MFNFAMTNRFHKKDRIVPHVRLNFFLLEGKMIISLLISIINYECVYTKSLVAFTFILINNFLLTRFF
jgi:hypothetical protein